MCVLSADLPVVRSPSDERKAGSSMPSEAQVVIGGVDTHKETHVAAVIDERGRLLGTASFATTHKGLGELSAWMASFGEILKVGVEGTGAYGAGLSRHLAERGIEVIEVIRPNRQARRRRGKSDTADAEAAARAVLSGEASVVPKTQGGIVESIRVLRVAFTSARRFRSQVGLQIRDLIVTAREELRSVLGSLSTAERVDRCARFRLAGEALDPLAATRLGLRTLGRRYQALSAEMAEPGSPCPAHRPGQSGPARRDRRGGGCRRHRVGGRRRQSGANEKRSRIRCSLWSLPDRGLLGKGCAPSAQPVRQPPGQPCPVAHRHGTPHLRSRNPGLRRTPQSRGQVRSGNHALSKPGSTCVQTLGRHNCKEVEVT